MTPMENLTESAFTIDLLVTSIKPHLRQRRKQIAIDLLNRCWKGLLAIGFRPLQRDRVVSGPTGGKGQGSVPPLYGRDGPKWQYE